MNLMSIAIFDQLINEHEAYIVAVSLSRENVRV